MKMDRKHSENQTEKTECGQSTNGQGSQAFYGKEKTVPHTTQS